MESNSLLLVVSVFLIVLVGNGVVLGDGRENGQNRTLSMRPVRLRP